MPPSNSLRNGLGGGSIDRSQGRSAGGFDGRVGRGPSAHGLVPWGPAGPTFAVEGGAAAIALDIHLEDRGVVDETVDRRQRHRLVGEDLAPFAEGLVGGNEQRAALVAGADQFEQDAGLGLILADPRLRGGRL